MAEEVRFNCSLKPDDLMFRSLSGWEELGRLPEYVVELLRPEKLGALKAQELLGKGASVTLMLDNKQERHLHGVVAEFERGGTSGRNHVYRVTLRPWLWQLTLGADCRIFQDKTAVQILDAVFAEYDSSKVDKRLTGSCASRPYTVQYRESDFDFVSRLMEEEGIYYYFKHEESQHTLVLCNSPSGHDPIPGDKLDWSAKQGENIEREDIVTEWSRQHSMQPLKYTHTDFAAEAPSTDLKASAERSVPYAKPNDLEVYDYPGEHDDLAMGTNTGSKVQAGKDSAQHEINRYESRHSVATGLTPFRGVACGRTFAFKFHDDADGYLITGTVTEIRYAGNETNVEKPGCDYMCRFNAVPKTVHFLPQRSVARPVVNGPQTATVVGPAGDEIHTDKYGRVKLHFHWDRLGKKDEKSSCWVRVSYPSAGKAFGGLSLPRIGEEVVVSFLEGDPDRPLVTGRVYNGESMPPYELPKYANISGWTTRSTPKGGAGGNELYFSDEKGKELVYLRAEYDMTFKVTNDYSTWVMGSTRITTDKDRVESVGKSYSLSVGEAAAISVANDLSVNAGGDIYASTGGALALNVSSNLVTAVGASAEVAVASSMDLSVGAGLKVTASAGADLKANVIAIESATTITLKAGASFIQLGPDGVTIQGTMVNINPGGAGGPAKPAQTSKPTKPKEPTKKTEQKHPLGR
ncbi:type VI secretion system tip protein VgrG [Xylophilus rhododendri]|uniref:Type VI secretion system tip protein VgrG n=1 Tax=Xylophilus rhododendri TaxID=2697032 RepID=A0A857JBB6_9BURK|nr:type VI secretion system tip protein TssI/VgrG [Xylophilus rhododendri]QHJ00978.1 type VI secretion system tip protein VgrG [Xylophilus rhododendri]